jgi:hypothetical protein
MARKKSYERMMNIEDTLSNHRSPIAYLGDLTSKKNQEILMTAQRPLPLQRINKLDNASSVKKQLQAYYSHVGDELG